MSFLKTNPLFNACFEILMCIKYSVLFCKLATSFSPFSISFILVKTANHYEVDVMFQVIEHQLQENILHHFLHYSVL